MAMLYDSFLMLAILMCTSAVYTIIAVSITGDFSASADIHNNDTIHELQPTELGWPIIPVLIGVTLGFFIYFWRATGQTLGMLVWKIKLVSDDGNAVTIRQGLTRFLMAIISIALLGAGYLALLFGNKTTTWHDRVSHTKVIRLNPK